MGPIGFFGDGLYAVDRDGRRVTPCAGAIGPEGDCYSIAYGAPVKIARAGHWTIADPGLPPLFDDELGQPRIAFDSTTVYVGVAGGARSPLVALDRASGAVRWLLDRPRQALGPLVLPGGEVVTSLPAQRAVVALDPTTGLERWRVTLPGGVSSPVADPVRGTVFAGGGTRPTDPVVAITGGTARRIASVGAVGQPRSVGPDGTLYLSRDLHTGNAYGVEITALTPAGRVRWRLPSVVHAFASRASAGPVFTAAGEPVLVLGDLAYRLSPTRLAPAPPRTARLIVRPSRFRHEGRERVCPAGTAASCRPVSARGAVAELRLPAGTKPAVVDVTLRKVGARRPSSRYRQRLIASPGSQWFTVRAPTQDCGAGEGICPDVPSGLAPGRYVLRAAWTQRGKARAVATTVTILPRGSR